MTQKFVRDINDKTKEKCMHWLDWFSVLGCARCVLNNQFSDLGILVVQDQGSVN